MPNHKGIFPSSTLLLPVVASSISNELTCFQLSSTIKIYTKSTNIRSCHFINVVINNYNWPARTTRYDTSRTDSNPPLCMLLMSTHLQFLFCSQRKQRTKKWPVFTIQMISCWIDRQIMHFYWIFAIDLIDFELNKQKEWKSPKNNVWVRVCLFVSR